MARGGSMAKFLESASDREFTKLECGLLGALFASIVLMFIVAVVWFLFG